VRGRECAARVPTAGGTRTGAWTAIVDGAPALESGVEGVLHLDTEPAALHRFVVAVAGGHVAWLWVVLGVVGRCVREAFTVPWELPAIRSGGPGLR
jgi:hypothetical protein